MLAVALKAMGAAVSAAPSSQSTSVSRRVGIARWPNGRRRQSVRHGHPGVAADTRPRVHCVDGGDVQGSRGVGITVPPVLDAVWVVVSMVAKSALGAAAVSAAKTFVRRGAHPAGV